MRLICYPTSGEPPRIRAASHSRDWMDETPERFAHRCLPLSIANAAGWEVLNTVAFSAVWHGGSDLDSIKVRASGKQPMAISHFGSGVLTFQIPALFRTEPGVSLWVGGSPNHLKDAIQPLTGVVETDWSPYTFTMNWKFTRPGQRVWFEEDEPICFLYPLALADLEAAEPEFRRFDEDAQLAAHHRDWSASRKNFNEDLKDPASQARKDKWQKIYHRGVLPDGSKPAGEHRTRVRLKPFADRTGEGG